MISFFLFFYFKIFGFSYTFSHSFCNVIVSDFLPSFHFYFSLFHHYQKERRKFLKYLRLNLLLLYVILLKFFYLNFVIYFFALFFFSFFCNYQSTYQHIYSYLRAFNRNYKRNETSEQKYLVINKRRHAKWRSNIDE